MSLICTPAVMPSNATVNSAWIKQAMGFRQFSVRGLAPVNGEWNLVCLASNLRRMHRLGWVAA